MMESRFKPRPRKFRSTMPLAVFGLGTPLMFASAASAQITFDAPVYYQIPGTFRLAYSRMHLGSIVTGDFNNDGYLDIAATTAAEFMSYGGKRHVGIFLNDGAGGFDNSYYIRFDQLCHAVAVGDFDRDRNLDLVVLEHNNDDQGRIIVMRGQGDGTFVEADRYEFGQSAFAIDTGDVDGDGDIDVVVGTSRPSRLLLFENQGNGVLAQTVDRRLPRERVDAVTLGDLDGDGDLEVAVTNHDTYENDYGVYGAPCREREVLVGEVDGDIDRFTLPKKGACYTQYNWDGRWGLDVRMNDLDNDGDLDVLVSHAPPSVYSSTGYGSSVVVLMNDGSGKVNLGPELMLPTQSFGNTLAVGDLEGDGDLDLVVTRAKAGSRNFALSIAENTGRQTSFVDTLIANDFKLPRATVVGDFDGDGQLDVAAMVHEPEPAIVVMRNATPRVGPHMKQSPLVRGQQFDLTVSNAPPGKVARFLYAFGQPDSTAGIMYFGGMTLDLGDPFVYLGQATVDSNGDAVFSRTVPTNAPLRDLTMQAAIRNGSGGNNSVKTNPVYSRINKP